jgi:hypothetical protein
MPIFCHNLVTHPVGDVIKNVALKTNIYQKIRAPFNYKKMHHHSCICAIKIQTHYLVEFSLILFGELFGYVKMLTDYPPKATE